LCLHQDDYEEGVTVSRQGHISNFLGGIDRFDQWVLGLGSWSYHQNFDNQRESDGLIMNPFHGQAF
jgi:hypothetical protein